MHMWEKSQGHILNWFNSFSCSCICLLLFFLFVCLFWGCFFFATERDAGTSWKRRSRKRSKEAAMSYPPKCWSAWHKARPRLCVVVFYSSEFSPITARAQEHPSLPWQQDRAGTLRWKFLRGIRSGRGQTLSNLYWCHTGSVFTKTKSTRATAEILLSVWSVLMLIVGVYILIYLGGGD